ncbi:MAG: NYN domain-containing protein [Oscillospiraceae bacterium]|jgi:uncharacterized LabA/DUF88 family protein|nr:NYN domain-containing protein [Oscillospiraceae bacterium]
MLRGCVFIDHMNFDIALQNYYKSIEKQSPKIDYNLLPKNIVGLFPNVDLVKTYLFIPKPDDFLMGDPYIASYYKWAAGLKNQRYFDVVEGAYTGRPKKSLSEMDINDHDTYYKEEKGTDVNLATYALKNAFYNSYDTGFFLSEDTDYISVYSALKSIGKLIVVIGVKGQQLNKLIPHIDDFKILDETFFNNCLRKHKIY